MVAALATFLEWSRFDCVQGISQMLTMPNPTPYDLKFQLFGIPVRVHPFFWLIVAILGGLGQRGVEPSSVLIWVACVFVSILVHEFGHGLTAEAFGNPSRIALHGFGGLCSSEGRQTPGQRLATIFMGPGAGFLLFGLTLVIAYAAYGITPRESIALGFGRFIMEESWLSGRMKLQSAPQELEWAFLFLFYVNLLWGLVNLLPIWPLDGGQFSGVLFSLFDSRDGMRKAHIISLLTAGSLAALALYFERWFIGMFMAYFAFMNYQILQRLQSSGSGFGYGDDPDSWRR